ncbi:uncharacterized protein SAPINGB_P002831 [Magnusiomyces paraingens]|uniref:Uncharacterized protein n=1 Tax=Magnusiomyces paraingens TaxID=2606893 RepID=A0A5E8BGG2_9ASCO|nr:uncharacterized protein SAPINGB_P002831 [Saprochaete ingens]VVT50640.1 unnamed protein product [Saprochaete ingens]
MSNDLSSRLRPDNFNFQRYYDYRDVKSRKRTGQLRTLYDPDLGLALPLILSTTLFFMAIALHDILLHPDVIGTQKTL